MHSVFFFFFFLGEWCFCISRPDLVISNARLWKHLLSQSFSHGCWLGNELSCLMADCMKFRVLFFSPLNLVLCDESSLAGIWTASACCHRHRVAVQGSPRITVQSQHVHRVLSWECGRPRGSGIRTERVTAWMAANGSKVQLSSRSLRSRFQQQYLKCSSPRCEHCR